MIEMVLVVILTAFLAVLFYSMTDLTADRAGAAGRKLLADLRYAQQLANTTQSRSGVSLTAGSYSVFTNNASASTATDPFTGGLYNVPMTGNFAGVGLTWSANITSNIIRFDSAGVPYVGIDGAQTALAAAGTINVRSGVTVIKTITIQPTTGQITMN